MAADRIRLSAGVSNVPMEDGSEGFGVQVTLYLSREDHHRYKAYPTLNEAANKASALKVAVKAALQQAGLEYVPEPD